MHFLLRLDLNKVHNIKTWNNYNLICLFLTYNYLYLKPECMKYGLNIIQTQRKH